MATLFDPYNYDFSDRCHLLAREGIYQHLPQVFDMPADSDQVWADMGGTRDDFDRGIDRVVTLSDGEEADGAIIQTVQERFRRYKYRNYRELTATKANHATGRMGDFFKLEADLYTYAYISEDGKSLHEAVIVDVKMLRALYDAGAIVPSESYYRRKSQTILGFAFDELHDHGAILVHQYVGGAISHRITGDRNAP